MKHKPTGLCFPFANQALKRFGVDAEVVHADVQVGKRRIKHAWIEHRGRVYDWQNTEQRGKSFPIKTYYRLTRPNKIKRYTATEALVNCLKNKHHGPWS